MQARCKVNGISLESCPMVDFGISSIELIGPAATMFDNLIDTI
jgi:hypothetical protein